MKYSPRFAPAPFAFACAAAALSAAEPAVKIVSPAQMETFNGSLVVQVAFEGVEESQVLEVTAYWWDAPAQKQIAPPWLFRLRAPVGAPNGKPQRVRVVATLRDGRRLGAERMVVLLADDATVVRRILVPVSAALDGRPLADLKAADLSLQVDGRPLAFKEFIADERPVSLVVAFDTSGSMADEHRMDNAKVAGRIFFDQMKSEDKIGLLDFNDEVFRLVPLGPPSPDYPAAVKSLEPAGATSLWEVLDLARAELAGGGARQAVVLITDADGRGISTRLDMDKVLDAWKQGDVLLFAVVVASAGGGEGAVIEKLATASGGAALRSVAPAQLPEAARGIVGQLRTQYLLSFAPPGEPDGKPHSITLYCKRDKVQLRYRRGFVYGEKAKAKP